MRDYLKDIIEHTSTVGVDLVKVTGTATTTSINAIAEDRSVILSGSFKTSNTEFEGVFGMPNLNKLRTIIGFDEYETDAKISVVKVNRDGVDVPTTIHFENKSGDFVNDYRLMSKSLVEEKVKNLSYKGSGFNVEFNPTVANILRLKKQAQANSEETTFTTKVENGALKIYFGDASTHSGNFVFQDNVTGTLSKQWQWPVSQVLAILSLAGDKTFKISDQGAAEITVDSGLALYSYMLPAQAK
jgi:hypothetical protein